MRKIRDDTWSAMGKRALHNTQTSSFKAKSAPFEKHCKSGLSDSDGADSTSQCQG